MNAGERQPQIVWKKSTRSRDGEQCCVEVGLGDGFVAVRDSKDPDGPMLWFGPDDWSALLEVVRSLRH